MAPEVISRGRIDNRSDIYSLGLTMYSLLVGNNLDQYLTMRLDGRSLPEIDGVEPELMEIIYKMISYDKEDRYSSVEEVINAIISGYEKIEVKIKNAQIRHLEEEIKQIKKSTPTIKSTRIKERPYENIIVIVASLILALVIIISVWIIAEQSSVKIDARDF